MKQKITVLLPSKTEFDDYGNPLLTPQVIKARVQFTSKVIKKVDGNELQSRLEVDVMPDIPVEYGTKAEYTDPFGTITKGTIIDVSESTNIAGNKIYFRTVFIG